MIKILIVDDHFVVREGLKKILQLENDFSVIGCLKDGFECLTFLEKTHPDIIFLDIKMPGLSGIETMRLISQKHPSIKVIMLTVYDDEQYVIQSIKAGAKGYVLKDADRNELIRAVRVVYRDHAYLDESLTKHIFSEIKSTIHEAELGERIDLTEREFQVLNGIVEGKSDRKIGKCLNISEHTVRTHIKKIFKKLCVSTKSQAAVKALQLRLIDQ